MFLLCVREYLRIEKEYGTSESNAEVGIEVFELKKNSSG
jgi:hypothetical protein